MLDQKKYFITPQTKLAIALITAGISDFLQVDQHRSTPTKVYLVLSNPKEAEEFAMKFDRNLNKVMAEVDLFLNKK